MSPHGTVESHRAAATSLRDKAATIPTGDETRAWLLLEADQHNTIADELMRLEALRVMRDIAELDSDPNVPVA